MSILSLLIFFSIFLLVKQNDSLYKIPIDIVSQNYIPVIPIYINEYPSIPKLLSLDINSVYSWIFNPNLDNIDNNKHSIMVKHGFYMISGNKNKGTIYLNSDIKINNFNYLDVNQIFDEINNSGILAINKNLDANNIINLLNFDEDVKYDKYFGFCLDFTNIKQNKPYLYIGDLKSLNNDIGKLTRFPIYEGDSEEDNSQKQSKWSIKLKGLFISNVNETLNGTNGNNDVKHIDRIKNKGLIIDEPALIETIYNYIYVTKEAMMFLMAHYFNDKKDICKREDIKDENTYEIKYNCLKNQRKKLNNINIILENNVTIELNYEDLLNCAINKNIEYKGLENRDTCEFIIRYHNNIDYYALGLPLLRKFKTYFLFNDNSILVENNDKKFSHNYLEEKQFSNISRQKKKSLGQTIKELFNTTLCVAFIFGFLAAMFYLYDKYYGIKGYEQDEEAEKMVNRSKYANL